MKGMWSCEKRSERRKEITRERVEAAAGGWRGSGGKHPRHPPSLARKFLKFFTLSRHNILKSSLDFNYTDNL